MMERRDKPSAPQGDRDSENGDSVNHSKERPETFPAGARLTEAMARELDEDPAEEPGPDAATGETEDELSALNDRYLRLHAEFDNYRKRVRRDLETARAEGTSEAVRGFLPLLVDLERAQTALDEGADPAALREGIELVLRRFREGLARHGVEEIDPMGEPFDGHLMEAMSMLPSHDVPEGHVMEVYQKGLRQGDRLIEPARVVVSSGPPSGTEDPS